MSETYWIVWNPHGATPPRNKHKTEVAARFVARLMAAKHRGEYFEVLEYKSSHQVQKHGLDFWPDGRITRWTRWARDAIVKQLHLRHDSV